MLGITEMFIHLDLQTSLEELLRELTQQPVRADQVDPAIAGLIHKLLSDRRVNLRRQLQLRLAFLLRRHSAILLCYS